MRCRSCRPSHHLPDKSLPGNGCAVVHLFSVDILTPRSSAINVSPGRVWAPRGIRPVATGHQRFGWRRVTAFVSPAIWESFWYRRTGVAQGRCRETLVIFARKAGRAPIIIRVPDGARWYTAPPVVPEGVRLIHLAAL